MRWKTAAPSRGDIVLPLGSMRSPCGRNRAFAAAPDGRVGSVEDSPAAGGGGVDIPVAAGPTTGIGAVGWAAASVVVDAPGDSRHSAGSGNWAGTVPVGSQMWGFQGLLPSLPLKQLILKRMRTLSATVRGFVKSVETLFGALRPIGGGVMPAEHSAASCSPAPLQHCRIRLRDAHRPGRPECGVSWRWG